MAVTRVISLAQVITTLLLQLETEGRTAEISMVGNFIKDAV